MLQNYWVYLLRCNNGALYAGYTHDLEKRYQEHLLGKGAKYTRSFKPIEIAQFWQFKDKSSAMQMEWLIKRLNKQHKELLILHPEKLTSEMSKRNPGDA